MSICFNHEDVALPEVNYDSLQKILKGEVRINKCKLGEINYIFCGDEYLYDINMKFLDHDYFTDVITFDYSANKVVSGDIYISTERVLSNSVTFGQTYIDELVRVVSHGLLHLLGYNDKESEEVIVMRKRESDLVSKYNFLVDLQKC